MLTPLDILLDPVSLTFSGIYALLMLWEGIFPARKLPHVRFWQLKGIASYLFFLLLSTYLPMVYAAWLPSAALIDLSTMNVFVAALAGVIVYELGVYAWHRLMHSKDILWRVFHQMHHSAERLDTYGAFFFSPMDMIGFTMLGTLAISILVGIPTTSITIFLLITNFFNVFQHANIKTPRWIGYIIQRPESHSIHHEKGVHAYNYSDLPIFDILFGTFKNPTNYVAETGLYNGASSRVKDMLLFKDITKVGIILITVTSSACAQVGISEKSIELSTGVTISYVEKGTQGKTPVILLHGYTDSWHSFENVISQFSDNYHVLALTQRGHGNSSKSVKDYQIQNFADDVAAFISEKKLKKCVIIGHSFGGLVAQQFALSYPQYTGALVLVSTDASFADNPGIPEFIGEINKLSDSISYEFASSFQRSTIYKQIDSAQVEVFIGESLKVPAYIWKAIGTEILKINFSSQLEKISAPTLILWGNRDSFCSQDDQDVLSKRIPNAQLKVYKNIGHAVHWEDGDNFVRDVELFIKTNYKVQEIMKNINFQSEKISRTATITVNAKIGDAFTLFGAFEERKWAEGWNPTLIYPASEIIEEGTTFKTKGQGNSEDEFLWRVSKLDTEDFLIQYLVSTENRYWTITVKCKPTTSNKTQATVTYTYIGLNDLGNQLNKMSLEKMYSRQLLDWQEEINNYLDGTIIKDNE